MIDNIIMKIYEPTSTQIDDLLNTLYLVEDYNKYRFCSKVYKSLKISINATGTIQLSGSLPKYYYGNNKQNLNHLTLKETIYSIENDLSLNLKDAFICRLDLASNLYTKFKPKSYFTYLTSKNYFGRFEKKSSLYFTTNNESIIIYDKHAKSQTNEKNVLRYEHKLIKKNSVKERLKIDKVSSLLSHEIYNRLVDFWYASYCSINKQGMYECMKSVRSQKDFRDQLISAGIEFFGGVPNVFNIIDQRRREEQFDAKIAYNMKKSIADLGKQSINLNKELIEELNSLFESEYNSLRIKIGED